MPLFGQDGTVRSRRCTLCSIQYPPFVEVCRICGTETWSIYKSGPDADWEARVRRSLGEEAASQDEPPEIAYVRPHKADVSIPLHVGDGRMWLPHEELIIEGDYGNLESGSIVFVNNRFYELLGYSESRGMWWVEEVVTDGAFEDATPEDIINGGDYG